MAEESWATRAALVPFPDQKTTRDPVPRSKSLNSHARELARVVRQVRWGMTLVRLARACFFSSVLAVACADPPEDAPDYVVDLTASKAPGTGEKEDKSKPAEDAPPPSGSSQVTPGPPPTAPTVAPTDTVWKGKIAKTTTVTFGTSGSTGCKYTVTFSDVDVTLTLDPAGNASSSVVNALMTEKVVAPCTRTPLAPRVLTHAYKPVAGTTNTTLALKLAPIKNGPTSNLFLTGTPGATETMAAKLKWVRTDSDAYGWTVLSETTLTRQ
jgi:hypothetical protein